MKKNTSIAHLTSAHPRDDIRIYRKMCLSLQPTYNVMLVVADGIGSCTTKEGVSVIDVGLHKGRVARMRKATKNVYLEALKLKADIYHIHDPELMPVASKLKKKGYKVIFDCHEDFPKQLKSKPYLNKAARVFLPPLFSFYERFIFRKLDSVIGATPLITRKLLKINKQAVNINNYPIIGELNKSTPWEEKVDEVCYLGGIARIRGAIEIVKAMGCLEEIKLNLAGSINEPGLIGELKDLSGWRNVNELGFIDRLEAALVLSKSKAGLVTFLPYPNHIDAQPNKMFEYMSASIPVIASNYPLWRDIVEGNNCGLCIDPENPKAISEAIKFVIDNPAEAKKMGENGLQAIHKTYNWKAEEQKLLSLYKELLND